VATPGGQQMPKGGGSRSVHDGLGGDSDGLLRGRKGLHRAPRPGGSDGDAERRCGRECGSPRGVGTQEGMD